MHGNTIANTHTFYTQNACTHINALVTIYSHGKAS